MRRPSYMQYINENDKASHRSVTFDPMFEELYHDITRNWEYKARRLQARRWRRLKHQASLNKGASI